MSLTLLVRHADADLSELSSAMGLKALRAWNRGEKVITPTGRVLSGTYPDSRWSYVWRLKRRKRIGSELSKALDRISPAKPMLKRLRDSGGNVQVILRLSGHQHFGDAISAADLRRISDLGLDLGLEIFGEPQRRP